jgi:hypothetical protein
LKLPDYLLQGKMTAKGNSTDIGSGRSIHIRGYPEARKPHESLNADRCGENGVATSD